MYEKLGGGEMGFHVMYGKRVCVMAFYAANLKLRNNWVGVIVGCSAL